jgi:response regulator RpfG family c-di-GMP phosphodiesterase
LTERTPVIFLSGIVTRDKTGQASTDVTVGKRTYKALSKPFSSQELMTEVRRAIG